MLIYLNWYIISSKNGHRFITRRKRLYWLNSVLIPAGSISSAEGAFIAINDGSSVSLKITTATVLTLSNWYFYCSKPLYLVTCFQTGCHFDFYNLGSSWNPEFLWIPLANGRLTRLIQSKYHYWIVFEVKWSSAPYWMYLTPHRFWGRFGSKHPHVNNSNLKVRQTACETYQFLDSSQPSLSTRLLWTFGLNIKMMLMESCLKSVKNTQKI
jgi:hypothetical protein